MFMSHMHSQLSDWDFAFVLFSPFHTHTHQNNEQKKIPILEILVLFLSFLFAFSESQIFFLVNFCHFFRLAHKRCTWYCLLITNYFPFFLFSLIFHTMHIVFHREKHTTFVCIDFLRFFFLFLLILRSGISSFFFVNSCFGILFWESIFTNFVLDPVFQFVQANTRSANARLVVTFVLSLFCIFLFENKNLFFFLFTISQNSFSNEPLNVLLFFEWFVCAPRIQFFILIIFFT